jgi:hypothetical protein
MASAGLEDSDFQWTIQKFDAVSLDGSPEILHPALLCQGCNLIFAIDPDVSLLHTSKHGPARERQFPLTLAAIVENAEKDQCRLCFLLLQSFHNRAQGQHSTRQGFLQDAAVRFYFSGYKEDQPREIVFACLDESCVPLREFKAYIALLSDEGKFSSMSIIFPA